MAASLIKEYKKLIYRKTQIELDLPSLVHGYISKKTIRGKKYLYLQSRNSGKLTSRYLKSDEIETIAKQLALRKKYKAELPGLIIRLKELEQAAQLLDKGISRELMLLKISSGMDNLDTAQKERSSSFAIAMNAIEGVPVSEQTAQDIIDWQHGSKSFLAVFKAALRRYGLPQQVDHA
jgi:hypothetical protein